MGAYEKTLFWIDVDQDIVKSFLLDVVNGAKFWWNANLIVSNEVIGKEQVGKDVVMSDIVVIMDECWQRCHILKFWA